VKLPLDKKLTKKIGDFVLKFIGSILVSISLVLSFTAQARSGTGGGMDSGGGSGLALIFRSEGFKAAKIIATLPSFPLSAIQFEKIVRTTRVEVSDEQLVDVNGVEVAALTNPRAKLLRLNGAKIIEMMLAPKLSLTFVVHQYLKMAGINDKGYFISKQLLASKYQVVTNITCEANKEDRKDILIINYKETDSDGDKKSDAQSAFSYSRFGDNLELAWQDALPLIAKKESGVLLTINPVSVVVEKLFLPQSFLSQQKNEIKINAFYVNATPKEKMKISSQFVCKHVTEESLQATHLSQGESRSPAASPDLEEIAEILKKEMIAMLRESFPKQIRYVASVIDGIPGFPLTKDQFEELAQSTRIEFTDDELFEPGGMKVDALNYPKLKLIRFNYGRTFTTMMAPRQGLQLLVHEYLGIAGVDDRDYSVSEKILELRGETIVKWTCETEALEPKDKVKLSYREIDYNGDRERDETVLAATDTQGQELQVPISVKDFEFEPFAVLGSQILWASQDSRHIYQAYLPQKMIESSAQVKLPYFEVSTKAKDNLKNPAGTLSCQFGLK
jgi:hypothetical protein